jgi:GNAT superfamily N-acetyltransferase
MHQDLGMIVTASATAAAGMIWQMASEPNPRSRGLVGRPRYARGEMSEYAIRPLGPDTWVAFAALAERHNGVWGGCWCTWFQTVPAEKTRTAEGNRALKERLVRDGRAHAALVFDGDLAIGWCQFGPPAELPNIYHRKQYDATLDVTPDYRITCFFVDRNYRRKGVAGVALRGALELIAEAGGGIVEAYPHETPTKKTSASFLYSVTRTFFEEHGFAFVRPKGAKNTVMRIEVQAR